MPQTRAKSVIVLRAATSRLPRRINTVVAVRRRKTEAQAATTRSGVTNRNLGARVGLATERFNARHEEPQLVAREPRRYQLLIEFLRRSRKVDDWLHNFVHRITSIERTR